MTEQAQIKIGVSLLVIAAGLGLVLMFAKKPADRFVAHPTDSSVSRFEQQHEPGIRVVAENSPIIFQKDLETSIRTQKPPSIELEYVSADRSRVGLTLSRETKVEVERLWQSTLENSLANMRVTDHASAVEVQKNYLNDTAIFISELQSTTIATPDGNRLLDRETTATARVINELAIRRFNELWEMSQDIRERSLEASASH